MDTEEDYKPKAFTYSNQDCYKCNSVFICTNNGWQCKCETTESLQKIIKDTLDELPEICDIDHTPENTPELVRYWVRNFAEEREKRVKLEEHNKIMSSQESEINKLKQELEQCKKIIKEILYAMPVGNINTHTPENLPGRVQYWVQEAAAECRMREKWEELADKLIHYAKAVRKDLTLKFKKFDEDILLQLNNAEDIIQKYEKLKNYE